MTTSDGSTGSSAGPRHGSAHGSPSGSAHGDVGEELRLLALALLDRVEPGVRSVLAGLQVEAAEAASDPDPATTEVPATCQWCPLCNLVGLARGDRPELAGRLAEQTGALLSTLRTVLQQPAGGTAGTGSPAGGSAPPQVQAIDVRPEGGVC
jgi:hypothetical protein